MRCDTRVGPLPPDSAEVFKFRQQPGWRAVAVPCRTGRALQVLPCRCAQVCGSVRRAPPCPCSPQAPQNARSHADTTSLARAGSAHPAAWFPTRKLSSKETATEYQCDARPGHCSRTLSCVFHPPQKEVCEKEFKNFFFFKSRAISKQQSLHEKGYNCSTARKDPGLLRV